MFSPLRRRGAAPSSAASTAAVVAVGAPASARRRSLAPRHAGRRAGSLPSPPSGDGSVSVKRLTPTTTCSPDSMQPGPLGHRRHEPRLQRLDSVERTAHREDLVELGPAPRRRARRSCVDDCGALEDVVVLEDVGLVGEYLLHPQRPLLIPRSRQAERLVPCRQLDAAGPRRLRQGHGEHLEDDPLHVVLRLRLGESEAVDLDAVAEPQRLCVGHPVALTADALPEHAEGAQLADLLDEADAGVDEERDRSEHVGEAVGGDLTGLPHSVEHPDRGRQRIGQLLHRGRSGLLQVIGADVDRVPHRRVGRAPRDDIDGQPPRRRGRQDVRAPRAGTP